LSVLPDVFKTGISQVKTEYKTNPIFTETLNHLSYLKMVCYFCRI